MCVFCRRWKKESSILKHSCEAALENRPVDVEPGPAWDHKRHKHLGSPAPKYTTRKRERKTTTKKPGGPLFHLLLAGNKHVKGKRSLVKVGGCRCSMVLSSQDPGQIQTHSTETKLPEVGVCVFVCIRLVARIRVRSHLAKQ